MYILFHLLDNIKKSLYVIMTHSDDEILEELMEEINEHNFNRIGAFKLKKPLIGYRKIRCTCTIYNGLWSKIFSPKKPDTITKYMLAQYEIPEDAIVVRSVHNSWGGIGGFEPSRMLRANKAIVKNINFKGMKNCKCRSPDNKYTYYNVGQQIEYLRSFEDDPFVEYGEGINFFLSKRAVDVDPDDF